MEEEKSVVIDIKVPDKLKSSGWSAHSHDYVDAISENGHKVTASIKVAEFATMYVNLVKNKEI